MTLAQNQFLVTTSLRVVLLHSRGLISMALSVPVRDRVEDHETKGAIRTILPTDVLITR